jgi:hypothetical protein
VIFESRRSQTETFSRYLQRFYANMLYLTPRAIRWHSHWSSSEYQRPSVSKLLEDDSVQLVLLVEQVHPHTDTGVFRREHTTKMSPFERSRFEYSIGEACFPSISGFCAVESVIRSEVNLHQITLSQVSALLGKHAALSRSGAAKSLSFLGERVRVGWLLGMSVRACVNT